MPITVNVGLSRKSSENYQSAGVSINVTAELDQSLLANPSRLQGEIAALYRQAEIALDQQAAAPRKIPGGSTRSESNGVSPAHPASGQGAGAAGSGTANSPGGQGGGGRAPTASQIRALRVLASRAGADLDQECRAKFGVVLEQIKIAQASTMIDLLKARLAKQPGEPLSQNGHASTQGSPHGGRR